MLIAIAPPALGIRGGTCSTESSDINMPGRPALERAVAGTLGCVLNEQRACPRGLVDLPAKLGADVSAVIRDLSASGMYVEIDGEHQVPRGSTFELQVEGARVKCTAQAEAVRVDRQSGFMGVGVKFHSIELEPVEARPRRASVPVERPGEESARQKVCHAGLYGRLPRT